ncbi:TPA: LacI family DNA-binding transcriptional regulator [Streptococcus pneumoniae]|uniref:LacI family DNA-binding transcriptional regulator n=1 Tax=Streptococcus pneumoniae TaxID=1313 RepID=UPI000B594BDD|nr:LacI family DNA-binding transcriptional regulator [Streptococcus pneumoniae]SNN25074.1 catabolite control protein [Streptococcus pneumoniae]VNG73217.1 catabolite control protein [Streptococcus pneumoniae]HEW0372868.1 LacI family DNA-binding transcriptional regulator [Streptococcus pneumoniae]
MKNINGKKVTIYDIARLSGFSPKTVSRVINGGVNVKEETYQAIQKVIEELSYIPNAYAKNLTKKEAINILISVKKIDSFPLIWFHTLLDKVLRTCKEFGVNAIVEYFGEEDTISNSIISSTGSLVDGVIVFYESVDDIRIQYLKKNHMPFLVFGEFQTSGVVYVSNNNFQATYDMMKAVTEEKFKNMWLLMGGESHVNKDRERGVRSFLNDKNYFMDLKVIYGLSTIDSVYSYAMQHLTTQNYPDIIFVSGDEKVQGLIRACYEKGILIPDDISIIGFDNIPISQYYTPALSTIAPNYVKLAKEMIEGVLAIIKGESVTSVEVSPKFVRRQSF